MLLSSFWWLQAIHGVPGLGDVSLQSLCLCLHIASPLYLSLKCSPAFFYKDICHCIQGPCQVQDTSSQNLSFISARPFFQISSHSEILGVRTWTYIFEGPLFNSMQWQQMVIFFPMSMVRKKKQSHLLALRFQRGSNSGVQYCLILVCRVLGELRRNTIDKAHCQGKVLGHIPPLS